VLNKDGARLLADALLGIPLPADGRVAAPATAPRDGGALLADLRGRLARARSEASAVRRGALLAALRYRLATERAAVTDAETKAALEQIDGEVRGMV
jgi:DEAD/DEAH box helicase domain-containing protein